MFSLAGTGEPAKRRPARPLPSPRRGSGRGEERAEVDGVENPPRGHTPIASRFSFPPLAGKPAKRRPTRPLPSPRRGSGRGEERAKVDGVENPPRGHTPIASQSLGTSPSRGKEREECGLGALAEAGGGCREVSRQGRRGHFLPQEARQGRRWGRCPARDGGGSGGSPGEVPERSEGDGVETLHVTPPPSPQKHPTLTRARSAPATHGPRPRRPSST